MKVYRLKLKDGEIRHVTAVRFEKRDDCLEFTNARSSLLAIVLESNVKALDMHSCPPTGAHSSGRVESGHFSTRQDRPCLATRDGS